MPGRKFGRSVVAQHSRHEIAVLVAVVGPGKERDQAGLFRRRGVRPRDGGAQVVEAERVGEEALPLGHEQVACVLVVLPATHDVEVVRLTDLPPERQQGLHRPGRVVEIVLPREASSQRLPHGVRVGVVDLPPAARMIQADGHLRRHARRQIQLGRRVAQGARGLAEVDDLVGEGHRVAYRRPAGLVKVRPGRIGHRDRLRGIEDGDVLEHAALEAPRILEREILIVDARGRHVHAEAQAVVECSVRGGKAPLNPLEIAGERHSLVFHVIERRSIPRVLGPA